jgi:hypothetical protein
MKVWKKLMISVASIVVIAFAVFAGAFIYIFDDMCGVTPHKRVVSPDGELEAVIYQFDCGATTGFSTQVSILETGEEIPVEPGNIFTSSGHPDQVAPDVLWVDRAHLNIRRKSGAEAYKAEASWGWPWNSVKVTFE